MFQRRGAYLPHLTMQREDGSGSGRAFEREVSRGWGVGGWFSPKCPKWDISRLLTNHMGRQEACHTTFCGVFCTPSSPPHLEDHPSYATECIRQVGRRNAHIFINMSCRDFAFRTCTVRRLSSLVTWDYPSVAVGCVENVWCNFWMTPYRARC